ncbi:MAG: hypothetical protein JWO95_3415, partial [Verrucomicrobiales bacterium]|nr:hypothetical protein [Verrucomicrobiales bacterium]
HMFDMRFFVNDFLVRLAFEIRSALVCFPLVLRVEILAAIDAH